MKHLIVKHIGPLDQIDIELKKSQRHYRSAKFGKKLCSQIGMLLHMGRETYRIDPKTRVFPKRKCIYQRIGPLPQTKRLYQT